MVSPLTKVTRLVAIAVVLWGTVFVPAVALAQDRGVIIGIVTDTSKKRLPGVMITVTTGNGARTVVTDMDGRYRLPALPLGTHRVVAELVGFTLTAKEVELTSRYPENDASFIMYGAPLEETISTPGPGRPAPPLRYRVWPLGPDQR
jgi:hypothetical protein